MAKRSLVQTTQWVAGNLRQARQVSDVEVLSDQVLRIAREMHDPFVSGIVSTARVDIEAVMPLITSKHQVEIIANIPKESFWTGGAINLAQENNIATGSYGDLLRVIDVEDVRNFRARETIFIERGLRQHARIVSFTRVHDRLYRITRHGLPDLSVVMLNEYELTADQLRTARDRYGAFAIAVITNPNGSATQSADDAAATMGAEILDWRRFFRRLNKR